MSSTAHHEHQLPLRIRDKICDNLEVTDNQEVTRMGVHIHHCSHDGQEQASREHQRDSHHTQRTTHGATDNLGAVFIYLPPRRNMMKIAGFKELSTGRRQ